MNFDELIFLDGAMGTMLQARGMKPGDNPCVFGAENPQILEDIHRGYFEAGSQIVLSNTFGASVPKMKDSGMSCEEATFAAVSAAKEALILSSGPMSVISISVFPGLRRRCPFQSSVSQYNIRTPRPP